LARVFIEQFEHRPGGHCSSTALRDLLKFNGHDLSEDMVFGLGAGVAFVYYANQNMVPPVYIGGRISNLEQHLCKNLGIGVELVSGLSDQESWRAIKEMLDSGTPVVVHADVYYLDYLRAKRHFSAHRIVLLGYDEEKGVAFVGDNDRDEVQECTLANLAKARSSAFLPQPADNAFYKFEMPAALTPLEEAIPSAIAEVVKYNIHIPPERARYGRNGDKIVKGIDGLREFVKELPGWPGSMNQETLSLLCKSIYVNAEKGGTGYGGFFRRIYGRFLKEASGFIGGPDLDKLGDEFIAIGDLWTRLSLTFKDLSGDGSEAVERAQPIALEIQAREERVYVDLEEAHAALVG